MQDLFKKTEMLLSDTNIDSKKFWSVHVNVSQNQAILFAYYDSELAKSISSFADGKLEETGFIKFIFNKYETRFEIILC